MSDDRRRILDLLAQHKITVDEADELMRALDTKGAAAGDADQALRWFRVSIHKTAKDGKKDQDVNIRVPIAIVRSGMRLGALIPGLAGDQVAARLREKGLDVDFSKLDSASIDAMLRELGDTNIEIESGRSQVRITCE